MSENLRIVLTDRRPVTVDKAEWPVVASATDDSDVGHDYARHSQALFRGELDKYRLTVRQHKDGRAVVYGVLDAASAWTGSEDYRGGELLAPGADVAAAIRRVGESCRLPDSVIHECVANLPAETLA